MEQNTYQLIVDAINRATKAESIMYELKSRIRTLQYAVEQAEEDTYNMAVQCDVIRNIMRWDDGE